MSTVNVPAIAEIQAKTNLSLTNGVAGIDGTSISYPPSHAIGTGVYPQRAVASSRHAAVDTGRAASDNRSGPSLFQSGKLQPEIPPCVSRARKPPENPALHPNPELIKRRTHFPGHLANTPKQRDFLTTQEEPT